MNRVEMQSRKICYLGLQMGHNAALSKLLDTNLDQLTFDGFRGSTDVDGSSDDYAGGRRTPVPSRRSSYVVRST